MAQTASQCFDISVWQFLTPLLCGARVQIVADDVVRDPQRLLQEIADRNVTVLEVVPSLLSTMLECSSLALPHLRWLLPTGEALSPELCRKWFSRYPNIPLVNAYGPAECSDDVAVASIEQMPDELATRMPIGRPIDRVRLYIVDRHLEPVPAGVAGELCVGGVAVGRGYVHDPARTAEVFVPDPFYLEGGGRLYRTGDLARHRSDGMIEYVGRRDHQVKIRGFRIELGEIEARLSQHPDVARSVVIAREDQPGHRQLVGYVVPAQPLSADAIRIFIKQVLPDYMVPTAFVFLTALPLTSNGKIDRKALPAPDGDRIDERGEAPSTPTQDLVAGIWSEILGIERIGRHDQFFDLGGHSLLATQVISRVRAVFQLELPLRSLFDFPTVEGFAAAIDRAVAEGEGRQIPSLLPVPRTGPMPLSFAQQRLWFLWQLAPDSPMYNISIALRITGVLEEAALRNSFDELARRHEVLRTTFPLNGDHPRQVIAPEPTHSLSVSDLRDVSPDEREAMVQSLTREEGRQLFDLSTGPLLRVRLLRIDDQEQVLLVTMHHIVSDGWSMAVLIEEMTELYTASVTGHPLPLPRLSIQYADYAIWQRKWMEGDVLEGQLDYWKKQLKDVPVFALPTDRPRPTIQTYRGAIHSVTLSADVTNRLRILSRRRGVTLFMTLLAVLNALLKYETGHQDIVVGTDVTNRNRIEVEKLIGFFINQIVLRTTVSADLGFQELLDRVREVTLAAHAHQDVPFEMLVASLNAKRDLRYAPLFQIKLILQHVFPQPVEPPGLAMSVIDNEKTTAELDLLLNFEESADGLSGWFEYNTDLFDAASIVRLAGHFTAIVEQVGASPDGTVEELERMLAERDRLQQTRTRQERHEVTSRNLKSIKRRAVGPSA